MYAEAAGRTPITDIREAICISSFDTELPFIPRFGRKGIRVIQEFIVLR